MEAYFRSLEEEMVRAYSIAKKSRKKGLDPELKPEIFHAKDLAERVEGLVGPKGISKPIRELERKLDREDVAIQIAKEIVEEKHGHFPSVEAAAEQALRTALAILTEGIVAAPLEGIVKASIKRNLDNSSYLAIYFAGPIRSAGGSAQALAVLIGDYIRRAFKLEAYKPTAEEISRFAEETELYNAEAARLQYLPTPKEIRKAIKNIPIEITGEGTDRIEVSGYRNLERIETNQVRGGAILVLAEGVLQKAPKVLKHVERLGIDGWSWLNDMLIKVEDTEEELEIGPNYKFIKEIIAGRPVLSYPSTRGGFRLRYGRGRNSGLASASIHPATMHLFDDFIAVGTQIKTERPGKGAAVSPCDTIEGPIVKLSNGDVVRVETEKQALELKEKVKEILFLGDILISYGDFLGNNHPLMPSGYCEEWWVQELEAKIKDKKDKASVFLNTSRIPSQEEAIELSERLKVPLHPRYTYLFHDITMEELKDLAIWLCSGEFSEIGLVLEKKEERSILGRLGIPFESRGNKVLLAEYRPLLRVLGIEDLKPEESLEIWSKKSSTMEAVNSFGIVVRSKAPTYIGARMGRPEKAKERRMSPPVNSLFPIGEHGGRTRDIKKAAQNGTIKIQVSRRKCKSCGEITFEGTCGRCGSETEKSRVCMACGQVNPSEQETCRKCGSRTAYFDYQEVDLKGLLDRAISRVGNTPNTLKGVIGMTSESKTPEPLEKGLLRAKNEVFMFKDGTIRFDATDVPLTHFRPREIGQHVERLVGLGYERDYMGEPLQSEDQILELRLQDIVLPESGAAYLVRVAHFVDELLEKFYGLEPYYTVESKDDLVGHLVIGLAPHTSAAILGRIIGFTEACVCYAHPFYHAAKRRNCDGDEDGIMLLMDALLNFSRSYLPSSRGGTMDAPLILTTRLDPREIDDEAHLIETVHRYPLEFYEKGLKYSRPQEVESLVERVSNRLGTEGMYSGFSFTHNTSNISAGPKASSYKTLGLMLEKVEHQLALARKIAAVNERDVANRVVESHFLPDLAGNLRAFSKQKLRCVKCNRKYRRAPLSGTCRCGGKLILTVAKGSVEKYLKVTQNLIEKYSLDDYLNQRVQILKKGISSVFEDDGVRQVSLSDFLGEPK